MASWIEMPPTVCCCGMLSEILPATRDLCEATRDIFM